MATACWSGRGGERGLPRHSPSPLASILVLTAMPSHRSTHGLFFLGTQSHLLWPSLFMHCFVDRCPCPSHPRPQSWPGVVWEWIVAHGVTGGCRAAEKPPPATGKWRMMVGPTSRLSCAHLCGQSHSRPPWHVQTSTQVLLSPPPPRTARKGAGGWVTGVWWPENSPAL